MDAACGPSSRVYRGMLDLVPRSYPAVEYHHDHLVIIAVVVVQLRLASVSRETTGVIILV